MISLVAQMVKHLTTTPETWIQSLGREDLLEKEMATHSSILAQKIPRTEEPVRLHGVHGVTESRTQLSDFTHFTTASIVYIPKIHKVHTFIYTHTILKTQKYDDSCIHSSDEEKGYCHLAKAPASFHVCLNFVLIILLLSFCCFIPLLISKLQRQIVCFKISYECKYRICSLASHFFH